MQGYLQYLKNVLGVSQILLDNSQTKKSVQISQRVIVWVEALHSFSEADHELLSNMLAAMKIDKSDMAIFDLSEKTKMLASLPPQALQFELVLSPTDKNAQTFSPQMMHQNKQLKAEAWTFLQKVMLKYQSLS